MVRSGAEWCGVVRSGAEWCGVKRRGVEWNEAALSKRTFSFSQLKVHKQPLGQSARATTTNGGELEGRLVFVVTAVQR